MIWELIRWPLGRLVLAADRLTRPARPQRDPQEQARIDEASRGLALYQFEACPFCVKTRRAMRRLGLDLELRDARRELRWRAQLLREGGRLQVPCLYIPHESGGGRWLYESDSILAFLEAHCAGLEAASCSAAQTQGQPG